MKNIPDKSPGCFFARFDAEKGRERENSEEVHIMERRERMQSITKILFITTQIAALAWVSISYIIAAYATIRLGQVFPVTELSQQAITTILGVNVLKVVENIFEHNDGALFGRSRKEE